eukprot:gene5689-biopygen16274
MMSLAPLANQASQRMPWQASYWQHCPPVKHLAPDRRHLPPALPAEHHLRRVRRRGALLAEGERWWLRCLTGGGQDIRWKAWLVQGETAAGADRTRTGRGAYDRIRRNGRGPDAGTAVSPRMPTTSSAHRFLAALPPAGKYERARIICPGDPRRRNGRGRAPDASHAIDFDETDASRARPQPQVERPGRELRASKTLGPWPSVSVAGDGGGRDWADALRSCWSSPALTTAAPLPCSML